METLRRVSQGIFMSAGSSHFAKLMDLAKETSSEKRRELLREVSGVFLDNSERTETECAMFDEIVGAVAMDMTEQVRLELAKSVAKNKSPLRRTAKRLATDTIKVAAPILMHSRALTNEDLVDIVDNSNCQDKMMAVSRRRNLAAVVSKALVDKGEDKVVASLLENETAEIDRQTYEDIADRAATSPVLHAPFVKRQSMPLDLLDEMYAIVEDQLRAQIMERFDSVSEKDLEAALANSRSHLTKAYSPLPDDLKDAQEWYKGASERNEITPGLLIQLLRSGDRTRFLVAFSEMSSVPFEAVARRVDSKDIDGIAILAKASGFEKALFASIAVVIIGGENGVAQAKKYTEMYDEVPMAAAQRAIRFWRVRETAVRKAA